MTRGSGAGGQHRNKTDSACHCTHKASGAHAFAQNSRVQRENKVEAFRRMTATQEFKTWLRIEMARVTGEEERMQRAVDEMMREGNLRVEVRDDNGRWAEEQLDDS